MQALTYLVVVLAPHAGRSALEALRPDTARLRQAYRGGKLQGVVVTAAGEDPGDSPAVEAAVVLARAG